MSSIKKYVTLLTANAFLFLLSVMPAFAQIRRPEDSEVQINETDLGFRIPNFSELLSFMVKFFFVIAGLAALFYMLWGALSWVTSGGDSDAVKSARDKIVQAIVGVLMIVATLAVIWALENIVFNQTICFGISCPIKLPDLLQPVGSGS